MNRRTFLGTIGAGLAAAPLNYSKDIPRKRLAVITTEWRNRSHAWHMATRFLGGIPLTANGIIRRSRWCRRTWTSFRWAT